MHSGTEQMQAIPAVSIVIPAFQTATLIPETLASVAAQTRRDFEALIIDDGSTDDLRGACTPFLADTRFQLHHFDNGGPTVARNRGIALARGRCLAFVDSDDLMEPTYLEEMLAALEGTPGAVVACCDATMFGVPDREGRRLSEFEPMDAEPNLANVLSRDFLVYTGATMVTEAVRAVKGFSVEMPAAEDFDLWVRLLIAGGHFVFVPKALARYRRRAGSLSNTAFKMHLGAAQAYVRALGALRGHPREEAICRRKLGEVLGLMQLHEATGALLDRRTQFARDCLREADRQGVLSPSWKMLRALLGVAPALATRLVERRQARLTPLARLAVARAT